MSQGLFATASACLALDDPGEKCAAAESAWRNFQEGRLARDDETPVAPIGVPGRPPRPELVHPARVPRRRLGSEVGRAALIHAIAHIEFNAINLALDAVYRFRGMPDDYYGDWLSVAADEARHFRMLGARLVQLGFTYGDFPAHDGLWEMARKTADACLKRMALVPRVLEARGLDVTPGMMERLERAGDGETVAILEVILEEEVRHVEIGTRWFRYCCDQQGLDSETTFLGLLAEHYAGSLRGPFNLPARLRAGFSERELDALAGE
ncbi:MAG: DUF455 family protein [Xanthomonadales bacterium]|nr:ferritin-like domain-containing protein [Xanthomonadales bacterium]NIX12766.1 DUF455 family protein [Xanthomonadales bacterium]